MSAAAVSPAKPSSSAKPSYFKPSFKLTHAGHGTAMRALALGLPLFCLPMGSNKNENAARGVGLRLRPSAKPKHIHEAMQLVLDDHDFRTRAEQMQRITAPPSRRASP